MSIESARAALWLACTPSMTLKRWQALGLMYDAPVSLWQDFGPHSVSPALYAALQKQRDIAKLDELLAVMDRLAMRLLWFEDAAYPPLLREIDDPPLALFVRGQADLTAARQFAIVGARRCTRYGKDQAGAIARELASAGVLVVSGLALGIDVAANAACADAGKPTVAVMGCGLDQIYPTAHEPVAQRILESGGALVSEYPPGMPPLSHHFPQRNRIISGMSSGVLMVEARERSGSMITVRMALEQGREVFVLPGPVESPTSFLPLRLLREGANPATCAADILEDLGWVDLHTGQPHQVTRPVEFVIPAHLPEAQQAILRALLPGPLSYEKLLENTGFSAAEMNSHLTMLEIEEIIEQLPGRSYVLRSSAK